MLNVLFSIDQDQFMLTPITGQRFVSSVRLVLSRTKEEHIVLSQA